MWSGRHQRLLMMVFQVSNLNVSHKWEKVNQQYLQAVKSYHRWLRLNLAQHFIPHPGEDFRYGVECSLILDLASFNHHPKTS